MLGPRYADSFSVHIADTLQTMGHDVAHLDSRGILTRRRLDPRNLGSRWAAYTEEAARRVRPLGRLLLDLPLDRELAEQRPDLVLSTYGYFTPPQVRKWRAVTGSATWALWYPDALSNLAEQNAIVAPYDALFFKDRYLVEKLSALAGLPVHYLPEACNPQQHRPSERACPPQYRCDVAVAGNLYPYRMRVLSRIPDDIHLRLYGNLTRHVRDMAVASSYTGEYVTGVAKAHAFTGAKILLNTRHFAEVRSVNARLFEATACGAFVLTEGSSVTAEFFAPGVEVETFDSADEMVDKIRAYLASDARQLVADAGRTRAHHDHTYKRRLEQLLAVMGMGTPTA